MRVIVDPFFLRWGYKYAVFLSLLRMESCMIGIRDKHEVFRSVISLVAIYVVYVFVRL